MKEVRQNYISTNMPLRDKIGALRQIYWITFIGDAQVSVIDKQTGKEERFSSYNDESIEVFKERIIDYLVGVYNSRKINE